jgi:hypothetical protein
VQEREKRRRKKRRKWKRSKRLVFPDIVGLNHIEFLS